MIVDRRFTVLQVVNEVCDRMKVRTVTTTNAGTFYRNLVRMLNEVVEECQDYGNWNEIETSAQFTLASGTGLYSIPTTAAVTAKQGIHHILSVYVSGHIPPLEPVSDKEEMRLLQRTNSLGRPTRFVADGTDDIGNPRVTLFPRPGATQAGNLVTVHYQINLPRYEAGTDDAEVIPLPGNTLVHGLHAAAILDESGGAETKQYRDQYAKFVRSVNSGLGRQTAKTGTHVRFSPTRGVRS